MSPTYCLSPEEESESDSDDVHTEAAAALFHPERPGHSWRERSHADLPVTDEERAVLYGEIQPLVNRLIRQYGQTLDERDELSGEIYCRYRQLLDTFDPGRGVPLRAYLIRQLITSVYTYARSQWRRKSHEVSLEREIETAALVGAYDPTAQWNDRLIKGELMQTIQAAIGKLPPRQRQIVIWRYVEERSFDEIAGELGICEGTARSLLRHGINRLRQEVPRAYGIDGRGP